MPRFTLDDVKPVELLREVYGDEVVLDGEGSQHRIMAEFSLGGTLYAVLQTEKMSKLDEVEVYHILRDPQGKLELETVSDDEEWADVAELYDEMTFSFNDGE